MVPRATGWTAEAVLAVLLLLLAVSAVVAAGGGEAGQRASSADDTAVEVDDGVSGSTGGKSARESTQAEDEEEDEEEDGDEDEEQREVVKGKRRLRPEDPDWMALIGDDRPDLLEQARLAQDIAAYDKAHPIDCSNGPEGTDLLVLTNATYHSAVRQCPLLLVLIHVRPLEDNPFSNATEHELRKAVLERRQQGEHVAAAVLDLMPNMAFARKQGVSGSHAVRLYRQRVFYPYWGQLLSPGLAAFLQRMSEPTAVPLNTREDMARFRQDDAVKVVGYLAPNSAAAIAYEQVASGFLHTIQFYLTHSAKAAEKLRIRRGEMLLFRPDSEPLATRAVEELEDFVRTHRKRYLYRLRGQDVYLDLRLAGKQPIVFAFLQSATPAGAALLKAMQALSRAFPDRHPHHRPQLSFAWMESLDFPDILPNFMAQFGFNMHERHADVGIVDLRSMPAGAVWYPIDTHPLTEAALEAWLLRETAGETIKYTYIDRIVPDFFTNDTAKGQTIKPEARAKHGEGKKSSSTRGASGAGARKPGQPADKARPEKADGKSKEGKSPKQEQTRGRGDSGGGSASGNKRAGVGRGMQESVRGGSGAQREEL